MAKFMTLWCMTSEAISDSHQQAGQYYSTKTEALREFRDHVNDLVAEQKSDVVRLQKEVIPWNGAESLARCMNHQGYRMGASVWMEVYLEIVETEDDYVPKIVWVVRDGKPVEK